MFPFDLERDKVVRGDVTNKNTDASCIHKAAQQPEGIGFACSVINMTSKIGSEKSLTFATVLKLNSHPAKSVLTTRQLSYFAAVATETVRTAGERWRQRENGKGWTWATAGDELGSGVWTRRG
jgi:hypothetical protein